MNPTTIRLPDSISDRMSKELAARGYRSLSAFVRIAVENELDGREADERLAASLERFARELRRLETAQQAQFAFLDAVARVLLHCLPEPPAEVRDQALIRVKERHERLLKMAARNMQGDARSTLMELVERVQ